VRTYPIQLTTVKVTMTCTREKEEALSMCKNVLKFNAVYTKENSVAS